MTPILVSACLLGRPVRYDGSDKLADSAILRRWLQDGRVVSVCPELAGGLPVPRPAAEIEPAPVSEERGGAAVLSGRLRVLESTGGDVTAAFVAGAQEALRVARERGIRVALLKEGSPSCGSATIHDGRFAGSTVAGDGVTAALLRSAGVAVFSEAQFAAADALLGELDAQPAPER